MSNVFISYSSKDREIARAVAYFLEKHGYSVWWDQRLVGGDRFGKEITTALDRAHVVVVIWSTSSVQSEWVVSEASRANNDGKLVCLRVRHLLPNLIPQPFEQLHTLDIKDRKGLLEAIEKLWRRPITRGNTWKSVRYDAFAWLGAVGTAISLFTNMEGFFRFARAIRLLAQNWLWIIHTIWKELGYWLNITVSAADAQFLSLFSFSILAGLASSVSRTDRHVAWQPSVLLLAAPLYAILFASMKIAFYATKKNSSGEIEGFLFSQFLLYIFFGYTYIAETFPKLFPEDGPWAAASMRLFWFGFELSVAMGYVVCVVFVIGLLLRASRRRISWMLLSRRFSQILVAMMTMWLVNFVALFLERYWQVIEHP